MNNMSFVKLSVLKKELSKAFSALESAYEKVLNSDEKPHLTKSCAITFLSLNVLLTALTLATNEQ